jgi:TonB family protein
MPPRIYTALSAAFVLCLTAAPALAQELSLVERLHAASTAMNLSSLDQKPWHLKVDVIAFDDVGKNPQPGTIEMWQSGESRRIVTTFGDGVVTSVKTGTKTYRGSSGPAVPARAAELLSTILDAGPTQRDIDQSQPDLRKESLGKLKVDCIMLAQPIKRLAYAPVGLFPTYCFLPGGSRLVASFDLGGEGVVFKQLGSFLERQVPVKFELQRGEKVVATAQVSKLSTYEPQPGEFEPTAEMHATGTAAIAGGVMAGAILHKAQPVYPEYARANHITGSVVMRAVIGTDGHIHALRPVSAPDPDLAVAAIAAVRQWTYRPYLLNGEPTEVDTTITVNFSLN